MNGRAHRALSAPSRAGKSSARDQTPTIDAGTRLALAEQLIASDDTGATAQQALEWLAKQTRLEQLVCASVDYESMRLTELAALGVGGRVGEFSLDLEDSGQPLVKVLAGRQAAFFPAGGRRPDTPLGRAPFLALPLRSVGSRERRAVGLLLVGTPTSQVSPDLRWFTGLLGEKLARLQTRTLVESHFAREQELLYTIINAVTDPILLTDAAGKLIIANARAEKLFIARDEESEGRRRAVAMNNMLYSAAVASQVMEGGEPNRKELVLVDPSEGSDLLFELLSYGVRDFGEGAGVVSILRNVTDLGHATLELEESMAKLRAAEGEVRGERHRLELIIDSVADPIVVSDPAGDILLMNEPAERLFTGPTDAGPDVARLVQANDARLSSFVSSLLFSGTDRRHRDELGLVEPATGRAMPVEAIAGKILSEKGELDAVVIILHDQTEALERTRLYEQLKHASAELEHKVQEATGELAHQNELLRRQAIALEQASAAKSQFFANMSHELRTPLNAMLGYTQMLLQRVHGELNVGQRKSLDRVDSNGRHLLTIINEILDISRIEAGRMPLHEVEFELPALIAEVASEMETMIARSRLHMQTALPKRLPTLRTDRQKVKQILVNLLSNAVKFTREGGIEIRVSSVKDRLSIAVADTGIGIAAGDREKVFEDFRQADNSSTRSFSGTGLGLSICRRLATMLGGQITLASEVGQGSTFTLHIPVRLGRR